MSDITLTITAFLVVSAFCAGFIDTLAGGGGLITVPALLFAGVPPVVALGTNKLQSFLCELSASAVFFKRMNHRFVGISTGLFFTFVGATFGTLLLNHIKLEILDTLVPFLLLGVFLYNVLKKRRRSVTDAQESIAPEQQKQLAALGVLIGFYNGFFGPGTGSIWTVALMRRLHLSIRSATMYTKPLNLIGNLSALFMFAATGQFSLRIGLLMSFGSISGGLIGAHFVMYKDARWLKLTFHALMGISVLAAFYHRFF